MGLKQCIEKFVDKISVTDRQEEIISNSFEYLKNNLLEEESGLNVKDVFLNGSYERDTIIRPLNDIDLFAVIDFEDYRDNGQNPSPKSVLRKFKDYLNSISEYKDKVHQDRPCVTVILCDKNFDILPTLYKSGFFYIPNSDLSDWQLTDPKTHSNNLEQIHKKNNKIKPVIKAVKYWKRETELRIPSFHVEEIAMRVFNFYHITTIEEGIRIWFSQAAISIDQARFNTQNQFEDARNKIKEVSQRLNEAKEYLDKENEQEAKKIWKEVFGREFPVLEEEEAKSFSSSLSSGKLRHSAEAGLSISAGTAIAASKGFYGEKE